MKIKLLLSAMAIVLFVLSSCEKCLDDCNLVPAKIIRYDCDRVIFQILDKTFVGDAVWEDVQTGQRYNNVVSYYNTCKIASLANGEKTTLYVKASIAPAESINKFPECFHCEAISQSPPQTKVDFQNIAKKSCRIDPIR